MTQRNRKKKWGALRLGVSARGLFQLGLVQIGLIDHAGWMKLFIIVLSIIIFPFLDTCLNSDY